MTVEIESVTEFRTLCANVVNESVLRLPIELESFVVDLMYQCFEYGRVFEREGKVAINV